MTGLGGMLDAVACGISGHIWVVNSGVDGVMVCSRCGAQDDAPPARESRAGESRAGETDVSEPPDSLVPEHRPWLEPPFTVNP
jgi:hypothetical protein